MISELFNLRPTGDYEVDFSISMDDALSAVDQATDFLKAVQVYIDELELK